MKKSKLHIFVLIFVFISFVFSGCTLFGSSGSSTYTVTFLNYDNSLLYRATEVQDGSPAIYEGTAPTRPDTSNYYYNFVGWDKDISAVHSNVTVIAKYEEISKNSNSGNQNDKFKIYNLGGNMTLNAYITEPQNDSELELFNVGNFDDEYYVFYFNLGLIKRSPVYTSIAIEYGYQDYSLAFKFSKLTEESLESSIYHSVEAIDTHSYEGGFEIGFEESISVGKKDVVQGSFTTTQSTDHHWTNNWGTTVTDSETTKTGYINSYSEGYEINLDISEEKGFKREYSYRLSFYETIRCYGVLCYDVKKDKFIGVDFDNMLIPNQTRLVLEESTDKRGEFDYGLTKSIDFNVDKAIKIAKENMPEKDATIHIKNANDFYNYMVGNNGTTEGKEYIIDADSLDLKDYSWAPFNEFKGILNGNGCKIKNWKYKQVSVGNIGLFKSNSGIIKNLTIDGFEITNNNPDVHGVLNVGLLCGSNIGTIINVGVKNSTINVDVGDNKETLDSYIYAGAISGYNVGSIYYERTTLMTNRPEVSNNNIYACAVTQYEGARAYVGCVVGYSSSGLIDGIYSFNNTIEAEARADVRYKGLFGAENGHGRPYAYVGGIVGYSENTNLGYNLMASSNDMKYNLERGCNHNTNKGGGKGEIKGN